MLIYSIRTTRESQWCSRLQEWSFSLPSGKLPLEAAGLHAKHCSLRFLPINEEGYWAMCQARVKSKSGSGNRWDLLRLG